ncbi:MAG TPA: ribosomal S27a family protein [Candidatus Deferrimicrobium sp.]|nr:ribosomal S27a family protein [Candidatus Deferrimicrobium sp.]
MGMHKYYQITDDGKLIRLKSYCARCGPGYFMAKNYDRETCGKCGYTVFNKHAPKKKKDVEDESAEEISTVKAPPTKEAASAKGKKKKAKK